MKTKLLLTAILLYSSFSIAVAQKVMRQTQVKAKQKSDKPTRTVTTNSRGYYDAARGGYVFMKNGKESFTPTSPLLPANTNIVKTSVPITKWLDLDLYPQQHYPNTVNGNAPGERTTSPTPLPRNQ